MPRPLTCVLVPALLLAAAAVAQEANPLARPPAWVGTFGADGVELTLRATPAGFEGDLRMGPRTYRTTGTVGPREGALTGTVAPDALALSAELEGPDVLVLCCQGVTYRLARAGTGPAPPPPPWVGAFEAAHIGLALRATPTGFEGALLSAGRGYQVSGTIGSDGTLTGTFSSGPTTFPLVARLEGDVLVVTSEGAVHRLRRRAAGPAADPAPAAGPDPGPRPAPDLSNVPAAYRDRFTRDALAREGGSPATEDAVQAALVWLKRHQSPDGRWDCDGWSQACAGGAPCRGTGTEAGDARYDEGVTALALLAFLGHGETDRAGGFCPTVSRGLRWLAERQQPDGSIGFDPGHGEAIYNHALATLALCEALGMTGDPAQRPAAERAVAFCLSAQNPGLGWKYGVRPGRNDTAVTGWMVAALLAARRAGLDVPAASLAGAHAWLLRATARNGDVGYETPAGGSSFLASNDERFDTFPVMTAVSVVARLGLGDGRADPDLRGGARLVAQSPPVWRVGRSRTCNFYYWFHGTGALFHMGGAAWHDWNQALQQALLPRQEAQGCARGSWDPVGEWCLAGGRVYATAIHALTLETYYRLPRE